MKLELLAPTGRYRGRGLHIVDVPSISCLMNVWHSSVVSTLNFFLAGMVWKSNLEHTTGLQQNCYARMAGSCDMTMAHLIYPARDIACFSGWSNMNMYLCVYIYICVYICTPVTDSGTYLSKVY